MNNIVIAIDGYSSTGKSTIAKMLAAKLDFIYIDSGAMYRAVTLHAVRNGLVSESGIDREGIVASLSDIKISFRNNPSTNASEVYINDECVAGLIRNLEIAGYVSYM